MNPVPETRVRETSPSQRKVLTTTCLSHGLVHVYELSVPALLLLIQAEFGSGDLQMGTVVNALALLFGLGALPTGYLVDRFGSRPLLLFLSLIHI